MGEWATAGSGPLRGLRGIEIASIGPGPFAAMMLADMGADVLRLDRGGPNAGEDLGAGAANVLNRGRPSVAIDLKHPRARELVLRLVRSADVLVEGFRPGVMERLGLGPDAAMAENPRLVYARMTGYGQTGPLARAAGHDVNYLAIAGVLGAIRRHGERPLAPLNLVADFGGGGMLMAFGIVCAVLEARASGRGQVVDAAMVDGAALLTAAIHGMRAAGQWRDEPGTNWLDSGAPWYEVYETADGEHLALGALESRFHTRLMELLGLEDEQAAQWDEERWPEVQQRVAQAVRTRTRAQWEELLDREDVCATPVLSLAEAPHHRHNAARETFVNVGGVVQPAPAPRFARTPGAIRRPPAEPGADTVAALVARGVDEEEIAGLLETGAVFQAGPPTGGGTSGND